MHLLAGLCLLLSSPGASAVDIKTIQHYAGQQLTPLEFSAALVLWTKESNWRPNAYNKVKVMGKNAGGIPQLLGLDPKTPAPKQIDRGLSYIYNRYHTPCQAWKFFSKKGYY